MAFELVEKKYGIQPQPPMSVSVTKSGFSLGSDIVNHFAGYTSAEIYLDYNGRRVGFKPTNDTIKGFKLSKNSRAWGLSVTQISKKIANGRYVAKIEDGMAIIDVKEIAK